MVTQESFLFSGTVGENIAFGSPAATDAQIAAAGRAVGVDSFVGALGNGYDSDVGKQGARLSAGQRQLVALARAFLANPAVLILDEASSSLDAPMERLVQSALRTVLKGRTAVIIAHRLSTVEIADRVLVLEAGRIVEDGPPEQLLAEGSGHYAELYEAWRESLL
jgi:ABC-type multidrug transport system fused ATPase/permease subunit